jgi:hypothetical protein
MFFSSSLYYQEASWLPLSGAGRGFHPIWQDWSFILQPYCLYFLLEGLFRDLQCLGIVIDFPGNSPFFLRSK